MTLDIYVQTSLVVQVSTFPPPPPAPSPHPLSRPLPLGSASFVLSGTTLV